MDPQNSGQRIGRPAALLARFGVVGLDQISQRLHLREKLLPLDLLLGCRQLEVREAKLLISNDPSTGLRSPCHCPSYGLSFPDAT